MSGWDWQGNGARGEPRLGQLEDQSFQEHLAGMRLKDTGLLLDVSLPSQS